MTDDQFHVDEKAFYESGWSTFKHGYPYQNPYPNGSLEHEAFQRGYFDAQDDDMRNKVDIPRNGE